MRRPSRSCSRALPALLSVLGALTAAGCGSATIHDLPPAAEPPRSPPAAATPAGRVVPVGAKPEGIAVDPQSGVVAVALRDPPGLALVDGATGRVRRTLSLPGAPRHLALAKPGGPFLVPAEPANTFLAIDPLSGRTLDRVRVGAYPHDLTALGDGSVAVGDERGNTVSVVRGDRVARTFPVATQPGGLASLEDGTRLVVQSVRERVLELYDARTFERLGREPAGVGPTHVVCANTGPCWVVDTTAGALLVFRMAPELELVRRLYLPGGPYGLAIDQQLHRLWVTLPATNELVELPATRTPHVLRRFATPRQPQSVAVDEVSGRVYVTGAADGVLQIIDP